MISGIIRGGNWRGIRGCVIGGISVGGGIRGCVRGGISVCVCVCVGGGGVVEGVSTTYRGCVRGGIAGRISTYFRRCVRGDIREGNMCEGVLEGIFDMM